METHGKFSKVDWGEGVELVERRREEGDKREGGLTLLKTSDSVNFEKVKSSCWDVLIVKLAVGELVVYVFSLSRC